MIPNLNPSKINWLKLMPLLILLLGLSAFFYFHVYEYINFQSIKAHREFLLTLAAKNPLSSILIFILIYATITAISAPGAVFISMVGGFVFGVFWGTLYVIIGATIGATAIFLAAKTALHAFFYKKIENKLQMFIVGFQKNAVSYLLFLRLVPLFPFWLVNIVPAFFEVKTSTFFFTTLFGIIPGTAAFVWLGSGLGTVLTENQMPRFIILRPDVLLPILALALLALMPILYKTLQSRRKKQ
jgi:uncharacterized membrane protein YdjX (TVP38/TMEM64 family)